MSILTSKKETKAMRFLRKPALRMATTVVAMIGAAVAGYICASWAGAIAAAVFAACCRWAGMFQLECEECYPSEKSLFAMPILVLYVGTFFGTSVVGGLGQRLLGLGANVTEPAGTIAWLLFLGVGSAVTAVWFGDISTKRLRWDW